MKNKKILIFGILLALLTITAINSVNAAGKDVHVNTTGTGTEDGTINNPHTDIKKGIDAFDNVSANDNNLIIGEGTFTGNNNKNITINKNVNIYGAKYYYNDNSYGETILDAQGVGRFFNIDYNFNVSFYGITFKNGNYSSSGGAILNDGNLTVINCSFINNSASSSGGAIYNNRILIVNNCTFTDNSASSSGAIDNSGTGRDSLTVINCNFINNSASNRGGAICNNRNLTVIDCSFINNSASSSVGGYNEGGKGGAIDNRGNLTISNCNFSDNSASPDGSNGGAIYNSGNLTITNCNFNGNSAISGGAIYKSGSEILTVINCSFVNNSANSGGAIYNTGFWDAAITLNNCSFINNSANVNSASYDGVNNITYITSYGGAIYHSSSASLTVINCSFINNSASCTSSDGGAIYNARYNIDDFSGSLAVINCSFINNSASNRGGAIYNNNKFGGEFTVINCSFINNSALNGEAIYSSLEFGLKDSQFVNNDYIPSTIINEITEKMNTTISMNNFNGTYNKTVVLSATLKSGNNPVSGRLIKFYVNNILVGNGTTDSHGVAIYNYLANITGNLTLKVVFDEDDNYTGSNATSILFIAKLNTTISMNNFNGTYNKTVILSATLKSGDNHVSDKIIRFYVNSKLVGQGTTNSQGIATYNYLANITGNLELKAVFEEDSNYTSSNIVSILSIANETLNNTNNSTNITGNNTVNNGNPSNITNNNPVPNKQKTIISMNDFKGTYNKVVTLSATLKSGNNSVSGRLVNFYVNGNFVGRSIANSNGIATFNYKVVSTGILRVQATFNEDTSYISSFKINNLIVPKLSEIKITNKAIVKKGTAKVTTTITNRGYDKGTFKLTFKLAKGFTYKKPKVSTGKISYNKKTRTLTWTITNLKVHKTKSATITWNLKAKKGNHDMTPKIVKNSSIRLLSNNKLNVRVK